MHGAMVGTPPDAFASDASAHPTNSAQRGIAIQPYRCVANSRKLFRKTMAAAVSLERRGAALWPRKNLVLPQEKNAS
jgi:hypothetical protein